MRNDLRNPGGPDADKKGGCPAGTCNHPASAHNTLGECTIQGCECHINAATGAPVKMPLRENHSGTVKVAVDHTPNDGVDNFKIE